MKADDKIITTNNDAISTLVLGLLPDSSVLPDVTPPVVNIDRAGAVSITRAEWLDQVGRSPDVSSADNSVLASRMAWIEDFTIHPAIKG